MAVPKRIRFVWSLVVGASVFFTALANPTLAPGVWTNISPAGFGNGNLTQGMTIDPSNPNTLYLCVCANGCGSGGIAKGIYKSTNAGASWTDSYPFDSPNHVRVDPKNSNNLYLSDGVCGNYGRFWTSTDGGTTWAVPAGFDSLAQITQSVLDCYIVSADPTDFKHVLVTSHQCCNSSVFESFDGGKHCIMHAPIQAVTTGGGFNVFFLYDPASGLGDSHTWLFMSQPGGNGWYRTTNSGSTWSQVSNENMTHGGSQIYYTKTGVLYAASAGDPAGPMKSTDNGVTWQTSAGGLNPWDNTVGIIGDGKTLYTGVFGGVGPLMTSPESDGLHWSKFGDGTQSIGSGPFEMSFDATNGIVYGACVTAGIWALKVQGYATSVALRISGASSAAKAEIIRVGLTRKGIAISDAKNRMFDIKGSYVRAK